ncbi:hypothetical protein GGR54DRAFT_208663 [Hypoxylon sp. NC1633]|nr:hypothetical protein GGR54DRAFT_208663 [Hypoxylon sp. NC1633]
MDPLSITAATIAIVQACNSILQICYNTRAILKNKPWCLTRVQDEIRGIRGVLETIFQLAVDNDGSSDKEHAALELLAESQKNRGPLVLCSEDLNALEEILVKKYTHQPRTKVHAVLQAISWDLSEREIKPILDRLARSKAALNLAISADEMALLIELRKLSSSMATDVLNIDRTLADLTTKMALQNTSKTQEQVLRWLSPVDPWESYASAVTRCHDGTGEWFLQSEQYHEWRDRGGSNLWLSGFPGSGKTVLLSTIIRDLTIWAQQDKGRPAIAYFYCDFRNSGTQYLANLLGSVVRQVILNDGHIPNMLEEAFRLSTASGMYRKPQAPLLLETLQLITSETRVILLVDALDEIENREESLSFFKHASAKMANVDLLVTSRDEQTIRQSLVGFHNIRIEDQVSKVDRDIAKYIDYKLQVDSSLQWLHADVKNHISRSMQTQAAGMFRWVQCQLETFSKLRTVKAIRQALSELPQDLYETYDRILARIPKADQEPARRILLWVSFAVSPLTLEELRDAIAIDPDLDHLDEESLLRSAYDILDLVGGLISVTAQGYVTLAHMSVKDYLLSSRIRENQSTKYIALSAEESNAILFRCCMAYISFAPFKKGPSITSEEYLARLDKFPLLRHAAISWSYYYKLAPKRDDLTGAVMRFYDAEANHKLFMSWVQAINADDPFSWDFYPRHATSLYYAASFGLTDIVAELIRSGVALDPAGSRFGGTALHGAAYRSHTPIVKLLLEAGADVNKADFDKITPLHSAATLGDIELAKLLLQYAADVHAGDLVGETPLDWAREAGQMQTLCLLQGATVAEQRSAGSGSPDTVWKASSATIPYFSDVHRRRSGIDSSIVVKVEIGTDVVAQEESPCFSPWILVPEESPLLTVGTASS